MDSCLTFRIWPDFIFFLPAVVPEILYGFAVVNVVVHNVSVVVVVVVFQICMIKLLGFNRIVFHLPGSFCVCSYFRLEHLGGSISP